MKTSTKTQRTLKVEQTGDYYRGKTFPKIRLQGKWLEAYGFKSEGQAVIQLVRPGKIELTYVKS